MIRVRLNTQPVPILPQQGLKRFYKQGDGGTAEQGAMACGTISLSCARLEESQADRWAAVLVFGHKRARGTLISGYYPTHHGPTSWVEADKPHLELQVKSDS